MNDEATTHYSGIVDNMALGFKTLQDIFGKNENENENEKKTHLHFKTKERTN